MALTLPYPNMDFTPLDILTADEMDQLVANIEFISQQFPIGASNINTSSLNQVIPYGFLRRTNEGIVNIVANDNLNSSKFLRSGVFYCPSYAIGSSLQNSPSNTTFTLVVEVLNDSTTSPSGAWKYIRQTISDLRGDEFVRYPNTNGGGTWGFPTWYKTTRTAVN